MRKFLCSAFLLIGAVTSRAADDTACVAAPTRSCVLAMAVEAIKIVKTADPKADIQRNTFVAQTWDAIINTAARDGQIDLALTLASTVDKSIQPVYIGNLAVAMQLAGRQEELARLTAPDNGIYNFRIGSAFVANGRASDFDKFVKPLKYSPYEIAAMEMAGSLMAGKADHALKVLEGFKGQDQANAVSQTLNILRLEQRMDASAPLLPFRDLKTLDGVADCGAIATGAKDKSLAEQCFVALSLLPVDPQKDNWFLSGTVTSEVVGALAAAGDWKEAQKLTAGLRGDYVKISFAKIAQYSRAPEILPAVRKYLTRDSQGFPRVERGQYLVRMLVMAGQRSEASEFVAAATDAATRDAWSLWQAEALAETGETAEAFKVALEIADPASRARALNALSEALPAK